jgi:hypothetical protein
MNRSDDPITEAFQLWGALVGRLREIQGNAARILAAERAESTQDARLLRSGYSNPTESNLLALEGLEYRKAHTVHCEVHSWPLDRRQIAYGRFHARMPWQEIERRLAMDESGRRAVWRQMRRDVARALKMARIP